MSQDGRTILTPPESLRLGNHLYFWLHASARRARGEDYRVSIGREVEEWRSAFPKVFRDLCVDDARGSQDGARLELINDSYLQSFDRDFSRTSLEAFVRDYVLGSPIMSAADAPSDQRALTLNVRRGDYYSESHLRACYGFDCVSFAERAVAAARPVSELLVVSDDIDWCKQELGALGRYADVVRFAPGGDARRDFCLLANSRRLVLANSTFSYWGAYVSNVVFGNWDSTWVPNFHSRCVNEGIPWQLDHRWRRMRCDY